MPTTAPAPRELTTDELDLARRGNGGPAPDTGPSPDAGPAPAPGPARKGATPDIHPPGTPGAGEADCAALVTAKVLAVFGGTDATNSWIHLDGTGWRRLAGDASPLAAAAAAARVQGTPVAVRLDADNRVTELYVW